MMSYLNIKVNFKVLYSRGTKSLFKHRYSVNVNLSTFEDSHINVLLDLNFRGYLFMTSGTTLAI